ncbi:MAG: NAD(P)/FAD-dependent oxidoreductase [Cyanobacteriota bacterium]
MLRLSELKLSLDHDDADLEQAICRRLKIPATALGHVAVVRRSVDARRRDQISLVYSVDLRVDDEAALLRRFQRDPHLRPAPATTYEPVARASHNDKAPRPIIIGAGPCGYFAALLLAQMGFRPLLLERGKAVRERTADTFGFWRGQRPFDPDSNAQFGEGGAGTFSDGKLYSQIRDPGNHGRKVLEELVAAGANPDILVEHRPHIGTFKLATVVRGLRARIEALGGEIRFQSPVVDLELEDSGDGQQRLRGVIIADGHRIAAEQVVLAVGHSARDTFAMLRDRRVAMEVKPFAVGVRIEHPQPLIDRARWGQACGHPRLGAAEYKLVHHCTNGRTAYSFCMCPGGLVVGATSEEGRVVTNGMSQHTRNERNANSGIVVGIDQEDVAPYGDDPDDPLAGVAFQRHWEGQAFLRGGGTYAAPAQRVGDFLAGRKSQPEDEDATDAVQPSYAPGVRFTSLEGCLPEPVLAAIREALPAFEQTIPGFAMAGAVITGVETRTSSPVRLPRHRTTLESVNTSGLFPAGEGAGYAGGILSAAIDGIKVAEAVALTRLPRPQHPGAPDGSVSDPV